MRTKLPVASVRHYGGCIDDSRKISFEMRHCNIKDDLSCLSRSRQIKADYSIPNDRHVKAKISAVSDCAVHTEISTCA
jgi:hypothetical protein